MTSKTATRFMTARAAIAAILAGLSIAAFADAPKAISIPAGDLATALESLVQQSGVELVYRGEQLKGLRTNGVSGVLSAEEAALKLIEGTTLAVKTDASGALLIALPRAVPISDSAAGSARDALFAAEMQSAPAERRGADSGSQAREKIEVEEVIVTGTHISGVDPVGSPVTVFEKADIERTGAASVEQFIQKLPQNFSGGISAQTAHTGAGGENSNLNATGGTGANLRGLGNTATLVLLNGRRVTVSGVGYSVDLGMIPLGAIERVEVLADGASAIYGSDAISGVVNIVTRKDFSGVESRVRYGTTASSGYDDVQAGQAIGGEWGSGRALLGYEYDDRSRFDANDRPFTSDARDPSDIFGSENGHGGIVSLEQGVGSVTLFLDGLYAKRSGRDQITSRTNILTVFNRDNEQYSIQGGARSALFGDWQGELSVAYSTADSEARTSVPALNINNLVFTDQTNQGVDARMDGRLFDLPAGSVRLAFGGHYREEDFASPNLTIDTGRQVSAAFAEFFIPLLAPLDLSIAARYENYSDFGDTLDPKVGLAWRVARGVKLRGSYGTSFRAPLLYEISPAPRNVFLARLPDPTAANAANTTVSAVRIGTNPALQPEESTNWTVGLDFAPPALPGFEASVTYFDIEMTDRIQTPATNYTVMLRQQALYQAFIQRNPTAAEVSALLAGAGQVFNLTGAPVTPAGVLAIVDDRFANVAERDQSGVDLTLTYERDTSLGTFGITLGGMYLFEMVTRATAMSPSVEVLDTPFWPIELKLRNSVRWSRGSWDVSGFVNYVDSYQDNRLASLGRISSWTTVDLAVGYHLPSSGRGLLSGLDVLLSAQNVFDKDPPYVPITDLGLNYDPTNADATGRFLALQVRKNW